MCHGKNRSKSSQIQENIHFELFSFTLQFDLDTQTDRKTSLRRQKRRQKGRSRDANDNPGVFASQKTGCGPTSRAPLRCFPTLGVFPLLVVGLRTQPDPAHRRRPAALKLRGNPQQSLETAVVDASGATGWLAGWLDARPALPYARAQLCPALPSFAQLCPALPSFAQLCPTPASAAHKPAQPRTTPKPPLIV